MRRIIVVDDAVLEDGEAGWNDVIAPPSTLAPTPVGIDIDLAVRVDKRLRRATGWVFDERRELTIDRDARARRKVACVDRAVLDRGHAATETFEACCTCAGSFAI